MALRGVLGRLGDAVSVDSGSGMGRVRDGRHSTGWVRSSDRGLGARSSSGAGSRRPCRVAGSDDVGVVEDLGVVGVRCRLGDRVVANRRTGVRQSGVIAVGGMVVGRAAAGLLCGGPAHQ